MVVSFAESQCQIAPIDVVISCFNVISIVIAGRDHVSKGPWNLLFSAVKSSFRFPNVNIIVQLRMEVYRKPANRHRTATPFLKPSRQRYNKGLVTIFNRLCRLSSTKVGFAKECDKLHTIFSKERLKQEMAHCSESNPSSQVQTKAICYLLRWGNCSEIWPRWISTEIVAKLSACQISGTRGEEFGKLYIKVLLTQGYPGEKCVSVFLVSQYVLCISEPFS